MTQDPDQQARSSFWSLPDRERVRERPSLFVGNVDSFGLFSMFRTVLANALVEHALGHASSIAVTLHTDRSVSVADDGSGMPIEPDGTAGEPGLLHRLTHLHREDERWPHRKLQSVRWHHTGLACVNFLSSRFEVGTWRAGAYFFRQFRQGIEDPAAPDPAMDVRGGSCVCWTPDVDIFGSLQYDAVEITRWLQLQAFLYPGVRIEWRDEGSGHRQLFHEPGGISTLFSQRTPTHELLHPPIRLRVHLDEDTLDFVCAYTASEGAVLTYANGEGYEDHAWFLPSFARGAARVLRAWAIRQGLLARAQHVSPNGLLRGLNVLFAFQLRVPAAAGSQCQQLAAPEAQPLAYVAGRRMMTHLVQQHPDAAARVLQHSR